jgi:hypothetical protein
MSVFLERQIGRTDAWARGLLHLFFGVCVRRHFGLPAQINSRSAGLRDENFTTYTLKYVEWSISTPPGKIKPVSQRLHLLLKLTIENYDTADYHSRYCSGSRGVANNGFPHLK